MKIDKIIFEAEEDGVSGIDQTKIEEVIDVKEKNEH